MDLKKYKGIFLSWYNQYVFSINYDKKCLNDRYAISITQKYVRLRK